MSSRRTYYAVLGITQRETPAGVRSAFRDLARRYHPDRVGHRGTAFFQEIVEAYQTLSDPARRADYDRGLDHILDRSQPPPVRVPTGPHVDAEPLIPEPLLPEPVSLMHDFEASHPSVEDVLDRIRRNFTVRGLPKSRRIDSLNIDVFLRPETALRGGVLTIGVPVFYPCPRCRGTGHGWGYPCVTCEESGMVEDQQDVRLHVPAGVPDGALFQVPLRGLGIHNLQLMIRVRIAR